MTGAIAYFGNAGAVPKSDWTRARTLDVHFLRGVRHPTGEAVPIALAPLPIDARLDLWRRLTDEPPPDALTTQRLTPSQIVRVAKVTGGKAAAALKQCAGALITRSSPRLPTPYEWDDLVLPADVIAQLRAFEDQVRLRWTVYEEWGFARLTHLGNGIAALFGGPPAPARPWPRRSWRRSLGLELLRVDLAGVVSKYIGETEKKLRDVFDACEDSWSATVLRRGRRIVRQSHSGEGRARPLRQHRDRLSPAARSSPLTASQCWRRTAARISIRLSCGGCASSLNSCRRGPAERLALWRRALPPKAPNGETIRDEIDFSYLSDRLEHDRRRNQDRRA